MACPISPRGDDMHSLVMHCIGPQNLRQTSGIPVRLTFSANRNSREMRVDTSAHLQVSDPRRNIERVR